MRIIIFGVGLILGLNIGGVISYRVIKKTIYNRLNKAENIANKNLAIINLLSMWLQNKEYGLKIEDYLKEQKIKKIAIYGMSYVGERLYDELEHSDIEVVYCIDKNANNIYKDVEVFSPTEDLDQNIDAIIVTAFTFFEEIEKDLEKKINVSIISIDDIVFSL